MQNKMGKKKREISGFMMVYEINLMVMTDEVMTLWCVETLRRKCHIDIASSL